MFEFPNSIAHLREFVDSHHPLEFDVVQNFQRDEFSIFIKQGGRWHHVATINLQVIVATIDQEARDVCLYN